MNDVCYKQPSAMDNFSIRLEGELSSDSEFDSIDSFLNDHFIENNTSKIFWIKPTLSYEFWDISKFLNKKKNPIEEETLTQQLISKEAMEDKIFEFKLKTNLKNLQLKGRINAALAILFDTLEDELINKNYSKCDRFLSSVEVSDFDPKLLIGILTITFPWKKELLFRESLFVDISNYIHHIFPRDEAKSILIGLE